MLGPETQLRGTGWGCRAVPSVVPECGTCRQVSVCPLRPQPWGLHRAAPCAEPRLGSGGWSHIHRMFFPCS